jgi:hypothetical protein
VHVIAGTASLAVAAGGERVQQDGVADRDVRDAGPDLGGEVIVGSGTVPMVKSSRYCVSRAALMACSLSRAAVGRTRREAERSPR